MRMNLVACRRYYVAQHGLSSVKGAWTGCVTEVRSRGLLVWEWEAPIGLAKGEKGEVLCESRVDKATRRERKAVTKKQKLRDK
jgi:hypothetical protein